MSSGVVDGSVVDRQKGAEILSLLLETVREGSFVRVSTNMIRVDKELESGHTKVDSDTGEGRILPVAP